MGKVTKNVPSACFSQCQHVELWMPGEAAVTILPLPVFHLSSDALKTDRKKEKKARTENQLQLRVPSYHNHK